MGIKPIHLNFDCQNGPILYHPLKPDKYEIGLCINGKFPFQIIYQSAHELCHIFIDPRMNGVFIEIICQKTAIDILEEIGGPLTTAGQAAIDQYIVELKAKAELGKNLKLVDISPNSIFNRISDLEEINSLVDREYNNLIAFKFKEYIDDINKLGIIKHIKNSISPTPPNAKEDLTSQGSCKIVFERLIENISFENPKLAEVLKKMDRR